MTIDEFKEECLKIRGWRNDGDAIRDAKGYCPICAVANLNGCDADAADPFDANGEYPEYAAKIGIVTGTAAEIATSADSIAIGRGDLVDFFNELIAREETA